jgi:hypothetical protein
MQALTKTHLDTVSDLIKACKGVGATYHEDRIVFADGNTLHLHKLEMSYLLEYGNSKTTKIRLLEFHIQILKQNA